jgi:hypothetical protein
MVKILLLQLILFHSILAYNYNHPYYTSPPSPEPTDLNTLSPEFIAAAEAIRSHSYSREGTTISLIINRGAGSATRAF